MKRLSYSVRGYLVAYDLKAEAREDGRGAVPSRPLRVIKKLIEGGDVERIQYSVLLVKSERALGMVLSVLEPYALSIVVAGPVEVRVTFP